MDVRQHLFQYRSYTPLPFLIFMMTFAHPSVESMAIGLCVISCGEFLRLWGVAIAGSETRTTGPVGGTFLVTSGPFAHVRNPLYLGNILLYSGAAIMAHTPFPWLPLIGLFYFLLQYSLIVSLEEEYLQKTFGETFTRYRDSVPKFLPTLKKYTGVTMEQPTLEWMRGFQSEKRTLQAIGLLIVALAIIGWLRG